MKKFYISIVVVVFLSLLFSEAFSQQTAEEYRQQQERLKEMQIRQLMDSGVYYMDLEQYEVADEKFKTVLNSVRGVPSNLTYYFGKNSFLLGKYKQSIDWLNKYIQLKGTSGQFYEDAVDWLKQAEVALMDQRNKDQEAAGQILSTSYDIDCGPSGNVICPVCQGEHVIIKKGLFGNEYKTCPYCNEHGILSCEEYNLLIRGELKPK